MINMAIELDEKDKRILFELERNARISDVELAKKINKSKDYRKNKTFLCIVHAGNDNGNIEKILENDKPARGKTINTYGDNCQG